MNLLSSIDPARARSVGAPPRSWNRLRFQLPSVLLFAVLLPAAIAHRFSWQIFTQFTSGPNTVIGTALAAFAGTYLFRRVIGFPGVRAMGYVMPAFATSYGVVLAAFFFGRIEYSRLAYGLSLAAVLAIFVLLSLFTRQAPLRLFAVPGGDVDLLARVPNVVYLPLRQPAIPAEPDPVLVADLRADLPAEWERLIAEAAIAGHQVYHAKQVSESLTGRVDIEHLSENSFGSLIPNLAYRKLKRLFDFATTLLLLPLLIPPALIVALAIKLDSPGPVFFRQDRMGYRGRPFRVLKFRTMVDGGEQADDEARRCAAITATGDARVTRVGRFLRRTRIDEVPQLVNVLQGDMSWIGPRPEALPLSAWYERELPFYVYRHIVRPGITGWAQVNQGHVAELDDVLIKLHYDFYYIKNFSAWIDLFIVMRTIVIVLGGFGSK